MLSNFLTCLVSAVLCLACLFAIPLFPVSASVGAVVFLYMAIDAPRREFHTGHADEWYIPTVLEIAWNHNPIRLTKKQRLVEIHKLLRIVEDKKFQLPYDSEERHRLEMRQQELRAVGAAIEEERDRKSLDRIHRKVEKVVQRELGSG